MAASLTSMRSARARRSRLRALAPFAVLAGWTLVVVALLARFALRNHYVFQDEANAVVLGRDIAHDLSFAFTGSIARGPERMTSLFAAIAATVTGSPARQYELLHLWAAVCEGLVAVPVWLAARELRLDRWQALAPAAIASAGSFAFFGIFTLNAAIGTLTAALLLWSMVRALGRPGVASDLLVVAALGLLALSRIGWAPLVAALAPAALAALWLERPQGERLVRWLARLPRRLVRRHPLLTPLALAALAYGLAAGPSQLLGGQLYGGVRLQPHIALSVLWDNTRTLGAHVAIGLAVVPLVLALPAIARGLARPADPLEGAYAWLALGLIVVFSYAYYLSMNEDRYFAVLVAPLALAAAVGTFRRPLPPWTVLASGALVTALVATSYTWPTRDPFSYFVAPTSRFYSDVVVGKLTQHLPGPAGLYAAAVVAAAALAAALVVAVARQPRRVGRMGVAAGGVVLAAVLAFQLAAMDHPERKFTQLAGMTDLDPAQLELLDRADGGRAVRPLAVDGVVDPDLAAQLPMLEVYNASLSLTPFSVARGGSPGGPVDATIDWRTGAIRTDTPPALVLQMAGAEQVGIAGRTLPPRQPFAWAQLVRPRAPLRAAWIVRGTGPDRYPAAGTPVVVDVFPTHSRHACLTGQLFAHPFAEGPVRYRLAGAGRMLRGVLAPGGPRPFSVPVDPARTTRITLTGQARRLTVGGSRGPSVADLAVAPCGRG